MKMSTRTQVTIALVLALSAALAAPGLAQDDDLAKKLANPISSLISLPIQANYDSDLGLDEEGSVWRVNVQPVIPFSLGERWNLISRTIVPLVDQSDVPMRGFGESGLGDTVQSLFFSPKAATAGGLVWGIGPVLLLPTASNAALGAEKWGLGPTFVVLKQSGPWTVGGLGNHIESVAGDDRRADVSATFVQPFVSYITKTKTTLGLNTEATYDWRSEQWSVPVNLSVSQLTALGKRPLQLGAGIRYWAESPAGGPQDWGGRVFVTFLFPK